MSRLCIVIGMFVFSTIGYWLGSMIGIMTGVVLSGIGSMVGVYIGWRIHRDYIG